MASSSHYHYHRDDDNDDFDTHIEEFLEEYDPIPEPKERKKRIFIERHREEAITSFGMIIFPTIPHILLVYSGDSLG